MAQSISEFIKVNRDTFHATGAFDAILELDSKFYIDPLLLKGSEAPELRLAYDALQTRFGEILKLLSLSKRQDDAFWREAVRKLPTRELEGLCIGYSSSGTSGLGMGAVFKKKILSTAKEIVDAGVNDPAVFGLIGVLEEGVGCDRISDMVGRIIAEDILVYSERIYRKLKATTREIQYGEKTFRLPVNPHNNWPLLLVPRDVLRPLPIARSYDDIERVCEHNRRLRAKVNAIIGGAMRRASTTQKKQAIRRTLLQRTDLLREFVNDYVSEPPPRYDFDRDPLGEVRWHQAARDYTTKHPLDLKLSSNPTPDEVLGIVLLICEKFRDLVENNGLHELLYDSGFKAKHESAAQKLFFGIADSYCNANDLDLSPEVNSGRGALDFKISKGYHARAITEVKLTTHTRLKHGFETQLPEYQKAEKTYYAVLLVIHVQGGSIRRAMEVLRIAKDAKDRGERVPNVVVVKAIPKVSASKFKAD